MSQLWPLALEKQEIWDGGEIQRRVDIEPLHYGLRRLSPLPYVALPPESENRIV